MKTISIFKNCINNNLYFLVPYLLFLIIGGITLISINKGEDVQFLNQRYNDAFDIFFKYITHVGDGLFLAILSIPIALFRIRYSLLLLVSFLISGGIAQILKHIFDLPRPTAFLPKTEILHYVSGVHVYSAHSFPSGHTATAFAMFLMLSIINKNKATKLFFLLSAIIVGISRIYLLQHFFVDVYFGSMIGVIFSLLVYSLFTKYLNNEDIQWYNRGLYTQIIKWRNK